MVISQDRLNRIECKLDRIERKLDLLLGNKREISLREVIRQTHTNPKAFQEYLAKKGGEKDANNND